MTEIMIKNVAKDIVRACLVKNINITIAVAKHVVQLVLHTPQYRLLKDKDNRTAIEAMITVCVNVLRCSSPHVKNTLRIQAENCVTTVTRDDVLHAYYSDVLKAIYPVVHELTHEPSGSSCSLLQLFDNINKAVLMITNNGPVSDERIVEETTVAFETIFKAKNIEKFVKMSRREKELYLKELSDLTIAIRLYNKYIKKGGHGIEDIPYKLSRKIAQLQDTIFSETYYFETKIETYTYLLLRDHCKHPDTRRELQYEEIAGIDEEGLASYQMTREDKTLAKDSLTFYHQMLMVLNDVLERVNSSEVIYKKTNKEHLDILESLRSTINCRTLVLVDEVYPKFHCLAETWYKLQEELVYLRHIEACMKFFIKCKETVEELKLFSENGSLLSSSTIDLIRRSIVEACVIPAACKDTDFRVIPDAIWSKGTGPCHLEFNGFCIVALVHLDGLLIRGDKTIGVGQWFDRYYIFHSIQALEMFSKSPYQWVMRGLEYAQKRVHLIDILHLRLSLMRVRDLKNLRELATSTKSTDTHAAVQTETHPLPPTKDHGYSWDEWELRRRALRLAAVSASATRSTQTALSHFRASVPASAAPCRHAAAQTRRHAATNVPLLRNFVHGLRGRKGDAHAVLTLTRPVE